MEPYQNAAVDVLRKLEDEHMRLQRQMRTIQADRRGAIDVHPQFRKYSTQLTILRSEYIDLAKNLKIAKSGAHKKKDKRMTHDLTQALITRLQTLNNSEGGERLMGEFDDLLQRNNKYLINLRNVVNATKGKLDERRCHSMVRLQYMENKLETATLRFNTIQNENKKIRQDIEHMLKDRVVFNEAWSKMLTSLSKGKTFLGDLFEQSTLAYDLRDECCRKLRSLQEKGKVDQMLQMQEMRDLQKILDHDTRLHNFLATKSVMRVNKRQEKREADEKRQREEELVDELNHNKNILEDIHNYTHEHDIDTIIADFDTLEEHNFSLYKLLSDVCVENEVLKRDVTQYRQNIVDRRDWNFGQQSQRDMKLDELKRAVSDRVNHNNVLRQQSTQQQMLLDTTEENVELLFKTLDCSYEPFQNLLGHRRPSHKLLNLTFSLINEKVLDYMQLVYYNERTSQKKKSESASRLKKYTIYAEPPEYWSPTPINLLVPADPCPQCIEARWLSRLTDKLEIPFTGDMAYKAVQVLANEPAYEKSDRIHGLVDCRLPRSRMILAKRYMS